MTVRASEKPIRVLAARGGALGDFLVTLPAIEALRDARPGAELELLTRPAWGALAARFGFVKTWRSLESAAASALGDEGAAIDPEWRRWLGSFDLIVSWLPDRDGAFRRQALAAGAGEFLQGPWLLTGDAPAARQLATLENGTRPLSPRSLLASLPFPGGADFKPVAGRVAFHPGAGGASKIWPFSRWREVLKRLREDGVLRELVFIAGEAEAETAEERGRCLREDGHRVLPLVHRPLPEVAEALAGCALYLGHDTGVSHLAAACGTPCRLLFGPTDPRVWAPPGPLVRVLRTPDGRLDALTPDAVFTWLRDEKAVESPAFPRM